MSKISKIRTIIKNTAANMGFPSGGGSADLKVCVEQPRPNGKPPTVIGNFGKSSVRIETMQNEIIKTYINSIKKLCPNISDEALSYFVNNLTITELKSKYFYIQAETIQKEMGYVFSGLLRAFYIDNDGKEITVNFMKEGTYATHYTTFGTDKPSKFYFQTIEPTIIINISYAHIQDCCDKFPEIERYIRLVVTEAHNSLLGRMEGLLFDNAETRYLNFTAKNPDLFNRVSVTDLCTFLGVERQTLTRIRKKLLKN